ncbi:MAG: membrane protein insertion efficiency factor YidD [Candidatus Levybacteria bacterium]|nr:membrane protein insertion efficiency factor YidD [Candidatus Levybacteria bacterium]
MKKAALHLIRAYQKTAPHRKIILGQLFPFFSTCRYLPTCSDYTHQAIHKYGIFKGSFLGLKRFLSCNPFGGHGFKPLA